MSSLDQRESDLAVFKGSRRKGVARHLFDDRPICEKVFLRLRLRWELGLKNAALPHVPVRDQKRYRLQSLVDLLFGGLGKFAQGLRATCAEACSMAMNCSDPSRAYQRYAVDRYRS